MTKFFGNLLSFFNHPLKGLFFVAVVTALNAATFWPLAFDLTDWLGGFLGYSSNYTSFAVMPCYFYIAWGVFTLLLGILALRLLLSIVVVMALQMPNRNIRQSMITKITAQFDENNRSTYATGANLVVVFLVTFLIGLYSQNLRFEQINLNNRIERQQKCFELIQTQLEKVSQIGDQVGKLDRCIL
ncbi:MAG: hypothetical protein EVA22_02190 [Alteromonas sp.]|nr:MAG: hypothetical protein EVA22_02190 [Alteromonas sp.]